MFSRIWAEFKKLFNRYYCVRQFDETDCGAACIATIIKHYGLDLPVTRIRKIAGTDRRGTSALGLVKAAEQLGFIARGVKGEPEDLEEITLPVVAHMVIDNLQHYVVLHQICEKKMIIADPARGIVKYSLQEFKEQWTGVLILIEPGNKIKAGFRKTGLLTRFLKLIAPHKKLVFEIFLASMLYTILGILGAFYFKYLIDTVLVEGLVQTLHIVSTGMIILTLFRVIMNAFRQHLLLYLSQKIDISLILNYYRHVIELPMNFFDSRKVGSIISRLRDTSKIREAISGAAISVMIDTLMVIGGGAVLYLQSAPLFWVTLAVIPFHGAVVWGFNQPFRKIHRKEMEQSAEMQSYLVESFSGAATVKAFNGQREARKETETRFVGFIKAIFKATWMQNIQVSLRKVLTAVSEVLILWVGGIYVIRGSISMGQLITYNALLAYFYDPLQNLINLQPKIQEAYAASDRLGEIMDLKIEKENEEDKINCSRLEGIIRIENLEFQYNHREKILKGINLSVDRGEKVAFMGESGSGKTTLIKLLLKFYLPQKGKITYDNYNIRDLSCESLRSNIGYVPQDIFLFSGTVLDNIAFGNQDCSKEDIIRAAQKAQAHKFINNLPLRYNTRVGERGSNLSGGQKQRIALARAFLKEPGIFILDEATSNLDRDTELDIHEAIKEVTHRVTTIITAHRLSTIKECDRIIVFKKGEILKKGTPDQLLKKEGRYFNYRNQKKQDLAENQQNEGGMT